MAREPAGSRAPAIGIDLGTTHSCVAYLDKDGRPVIIKTRDGDKTMPSHVAFTRTGRIVGARAKTDTEKDDRYTIYDAKRLLGKSYDDPEVAEDLQMWPFTVVRDAAGLPKYRVRERDQEMLYAPEQISGMVLAELRDAAQQHFGPDKLVADVVITVPAYFNDDQRQATKAAAEIAKLNVLHIINEPTAAALAFGLSSPPGNEPRHVLVFDLGGGTFDTVLLELSNDLLQVRNVGGDTHLGGQDFDWQLMKVALRSWDGLYPHIVIENGSKAWRRLRLACELAKKELSTSDLTAIDVVSLAGDEDLFMEIDREEFEFEVSPLFDRCMAHVTSLLAEARLSPADIHDVVVVGGASRMPGLRTHLEAMFPSHYQAKLHMTDAVIDADNWRPGGAALAPNSPPGPRIIDATPMTLGIQHGELKKMHALIVKGSPLPAQASQSFTTLIDNQTVIDFKVFEGEHPYTCDNHMLGKFQMPNIAWGPAGSANIMVTMRIGEDGVLHTKAIDQDSGTERQLVVTAMNRADSATVAEMTRQEEMSSSMRGRKGSGGAVPQHNGGGGGSNRRYHDGVPKKRNSKMTGF